MPGGQLLAKLPELAVLSGLAAAEAMPSVLRGVTLPAVPNRGAAPSAADLRKRLPDGAGLDSGAEWVRASSGPTDGRPALVLRRKPSSLVSVSALPALVTLLIRLRGRAASV